RLPPASTLFPYTTLFRSARGLGAAGRRRLLDPAALAQRLQQRRAQRAADVRAALGPVDARARRRAAGAEHRLDVDAERVQRPGADRKSTRLNSSHDQTSY